MEIDWLARPLALTGLVIGTQLYFLLIRRRHRILKEQEDESAEESRRRSMSRLRHLRRHDDI